MVMGDEIAIDHVGGGNSEAKAASAADQAKHETGTNAGEYINFWTEDISDGSDIVLLGENYYENPGDRLDAIGADDALAALYVARGGADGSVTYNQSQIIAADFNQSGSVTSADAFDILQYSVFGFQPNGAVPKWVYVDDIESGSSTGGTSSVVDYDPNIDLFVGSAVDIDATAVLIGDVSESYQPLTDGSSSRWYGEQLEMFLTRVDVPIELTTYDGSTAGTTSSPDNFVITNSGDASNIPLMGSDLAAVSTLIGVEWNTDKVEFAVSAPDGFERYRFDTEDAADAAEEQLAIEGMAEDVFEAGETNALMVDYHTSGSGNGLQLFIMDIDQSGTLNAGDLALYFEGIDKNEFEDGSSIAFA